MTSRISLVTVGFKISVEHKEYLLVLAKEKGMTISDYLRSLVPALPKDKTYILFEEEQKYSGKTSSNANERRGEKARLTKLYCFEPAVIKEVEQMINMYKGLTGLLYASFLLWNPGNK